MMHGDHHRPSIPPEIVAELDDLLSCLCDEDMTADDRRRLNQILDQSHAARQYYLKLIAIHSALVTTAGRYVRPESGDGRSDVRPQREMEPLSVDFDQPVPVSVAQRSSLRHERGATDLRWVRSWGGVAIALCLVGLVVSWTYRTNERHAPAPVAGGAQAPAAVSDDEDARPLVVEVTYVSPAVRWQDPNASYALASRIRTGQTLVLEHGQVELTYATGAKLLLTGPSEFVVESKGGQLRRGELVARVPEEGHGFRIETPHGQVIDLGTEFGVVVDDFGVSQVSVFEGKVETWSLGATDMTQRIELTSGRGLQWTGRGIIPMDATGRRYHRRGEDADLRAASIPVAALDVDFRDSSLSSDAWKTIGAVRQTPTGVQLGGTADASEKPYLISRQEFDPSHGPITIVCDVRFLGGAEAGDASLAILTRSAQVLSDPGTPWQDMLARFVRCSFRVDPNSGEGLLEAGTKYEADRELWNNSWGGFSRPQAGSLYRLEMHDDGLNVTFSVSLVDNPSVRKTISFRSLFRGNHNFIAIEGSTAAVVVKRLQIAQDGVATLPGDRLARGSSSRPSEPGGPTASERIEKLIPAGAELLVEDGFEGPELDPAVWKVLGDVVLRNEEVQLGLPNEDEHIDTWRQRPYLITKRQFDPGDGALTIVGRATFAENYLHGYGGSFAVMTRADDAHGTGPGWENSILRRGVRSNFWPAALGFDQSLQIHEKPSPNTLSLLAAKGFQINPESRSYFFRVLDDGKRATLTFIDAENPTIDATISHRTSFATLSGGHIGFESCWGSPMLLDDVRILQSDRSKDRSIGDE